MIGLVLVMACGANEPPVFDSVNRQDVKYGIGDSPWLEQALVVTPGEVFEITVEVHDPEGADVLLWWPNAPPGFSFEPTARTGTWEVPDDPVSSYLPGLVVVAQDTAPEPEADSLWLMLQAGGWDSGVVEDR